MMNNSFEHCGCLMDGERVIYHLAMFRGHVFRIYTSGIITKCSDSDREAAAYFIAWNNK